MVSGLTPNQKSVLKAIANADKVLCDAFICHAYNGVIKTKLSNTVIDHLTDKGVIRFIPYNDMLQQIVLSPGVTMSKFKRTTYLNKVNNKFFVDMKVKNLDNNLTQSISIEVVVSPESLAKFPQLKEGNIQEIFEELEKRLLLKTNSLQAAYAAMQEKQEQVTAEVSESPKSRKKATTK